MNRYILILIMAFVPFFLSAQEGVKNETEEKGQAATGKNMPKAYEAFFKKGMDKVEGAFTVYLDDKKYYLEISETSIGEELLVSGAVTKGQFVGSVSSVTSILVFNIGKKNELEVRQQVCSDRAVGEMAQAVEASSLQPVLFSFPIVAYGKDKKSYIIDITTDLNSGGKLFTFPNQALVNAPVADRSILDSVMAVADGVKFMSSRSQTQTTPGIMGLPTTERHISVCVEWSLQLLPRRVIAPRFADARVGYSSISYNDYDVNPYRAEKRNIIRRWDLRIKPGDEAKYKRGELIEPANPINVYFDNTFSAELRAAAARAVEEWNHCFARAGFKNVLQIRTGEPEVAVAYHQVLFSYVLGSPQLKVVSHPATGEILSGNVCLSHSDWNEKSETITIQLGGYNPEVFTDELHALYYEFFRCRTSQSLGSVLGLVPNGAGSMAFTTEQLRDASWARGNGISSSVTAGCIVNYAAQPGDEIPLRDLFSKASVYDRWALEWGYRQFPDMDSESEGKAVKAIASQANDNSHLYYAPAKKAAIGTVTDCDLGQDMLAATALGIENLKRLAPRLKEIADRVDKDDSWITYVTLTSNIRNQYCTYAQTALHYIGKITEDPVIAGYNEERRKYMPKEKQEEAGRFLVKYAFSGLPAWLEFPWLATVNGSKSFGAMNMLMMQVTKQLFEAERLSRLASAPETFGNTAYSIEDMFAMVDSGIFLDYSKSKKVDAVRARLQYNAVKNFITTFRQLKVNENINTLTCYMINKANEMSNDLERLGRTHNDPETRQHYRGLSVFMKLGFDKKTGMMGIKTES